MNIVVFRISDFNLPLVKKQIRNFYVQYLLLYKAENQLENQ